MNVLITGATKGMGRAIALKMASKGCNLAICARNQKDLEDFKKEILTKFPSIKIYTKATDCAKKVEVQAFSEGALKEFGFIDVLINNAGIFKPALILEEEEDSLNQHLQVNLMAPYYLYKKLGKLMQEQKRGYIINICSVASKESIVNAGSYCVTKAALLSLNNIMREELMESGVKVTAILPGSTLTSSWEGTNIAADKFVQAEDVANTVAGIFELSRGANVDEITIKPLYGQV